MYLTTRQWKEIAQDLFEVGINALSLRREGGNVAVVNAWMELGDEDWNSLLIN